MLTGTRSSYSMLLSRLFLILYVFIVFITFPELKLIKFADFRALINKKVSVLYEKDIKKES